MRAYYELSENRMRHAMFGTGTCHNAMQCPVHKHAPALCDVQYSQMLHHHAMCGGHTYVLHFTLSGTSTLHFTRRYTDIYYGAIQCAELTLRPAMSNAASCCGGVQPSFHQQQNPDGSTAIGQPHIARAMLRGRTDVPASLDSNEKQALIA
eukprot:2183039-Rhodomonas_salina.2